MSQSIEFDITKAKFTDELENPEDSVKYAAFIENIGKTTDPELLQYALDITHENVELTQENYNKFVHLIQTRKSEDKGFFWMQACICWSVMRNDNPPKDSIMYYCNLAKQTVMEMPTPMDSFMRAWFLSILALSGTQHYNEAFVEAKQMIKGAKHMNYIAGLIYANELLARMFYAQEQWELSASYFDETLELIQTAYSGKAGNDQISKEEQGFFAYSIQGFAFLAHVQAGHYEWAQQNLPEIEKTADDNGFGYINYAKGLLYNATSNEQKFKETVETYRKELEKNDFLEHPETADSRIIAVYHYYEILARYYQKSHQLEKALEYCRKMNEIHPAPKLLAQILIEKKHYPEAARLYQDLYEEADSLRHYADSSAISKFAALMENENLQLKYMQAQMQAQKVQLRLNRVIMIALLLILLIGGAFFYHNNKLMKILNISKNNLQKAYQELIKKEHETSEALAHAEEANRVKNVFLRNVTHEIRTPLNGIAGFAQILPATTEQDKMMVGEIQNCTNQLVQLIDTVVELSDYDTADKELMTTDVDLNVCCNIATEQMQRYLQPGVSLHTNLPQETLHIRSNEEALRRSLSCLLHNAAKFTVEGEIEIGYQIEKENVHIYIQDTGKGLPADRAEWIFERFTKMDEFIPGFGLGLALAKAIVHRLHGTIELDTNYTTGARFVITLPL